MKLSRVMEATENVELQSYMKTPSTKTTKCPMLLSPGIPVRKVPPRRTLRAPPICHHLNQNRRLQADRERLKIRKNAKRLIRSIRTDLLPISHLQSNNSQSRRGNGKRPQGLNMPVYSGHYNNN